MSPSSVEDLPLLTDTDHDQEKLARAPCDDPPSLRSRRSLLYSLAISMLLNLVLLGIVGRNYVTRGHASAPWSQTPLYSPAQSVVRYENRVFTNIRVKTKWHSPPTDDVDQAWEDLYDFGISRIPKAEADKLPNQTMSVPGDPPSSVMSLDVFHQLHCLNMIRKALHPDRYGPMALGTSDDRYPPFDHVDHCVNSIRESLMCSADISVNTFVFDDYLNTSVPRLDNWHTCRDFRAIQNWARDRQFFHPSHTSHPPASFNGTDP